MKKNNDIYFFRLANVQPGDLVCDPMCGGGSIPIEGAISYKQGFYFAGDMHEKAVERTRDNLKTFDSKIPSDGIQWDVTNIPLRDSCLDVLITDLVSLNIFIFFKISMKYFKTILLISKKTSNFEAVYWRISSSIYLLFL